MKFKFDQIEIDVKIKKSTSTTKAYQAVAKKDFRMNKAALTANR